jgi:peptide/nickel transport system permease protein
MLGPSGRPEDVAKLRHQLGLDHSVTVQYLRWISRAARGDLGQSIVLRRPVLASSCSPPPGDSVSPPSGSV